ncbi:MAG: cytochrome c biogenesis protein [Leptospiraceae bacterium]|nr:cytochrome c biogenesis protein [Leptospiraceae bacterium]MDW7976207.1 cytochrome c biogenesis protein CcsA [Leptospiraceae bacterium]
MRVRKEFFFYLNVAFSFILIPVTILSLTYPPVIVSQGQAHRIFYIHVPVAWVAMYSPFIGVISAILYLIKRKSLYDIVVVSSMRTAFIFSLGVIISGPIWASTEWGTYWNWKDPRLMSFFILALAISSFFIVRTFTDNPMKRGTYSAIMTIFSALASILTWFSIRILTPDTHPGPVLHTLSKEIEITFWISVFGYHFFFWVIFYITYQHEKIKEIYKNLMISD